MTPTAYDTLAELFFHLTPTTLAAIVADLVDHNDTMAVAATALATEAGENTAGDNDFDLMVQEAIVAAMPH